MSGTEPSQGRARNTLGDEAGPIDDVDTACHHNGQLPQDPPPAFSNPCEEDATFAVPHPSGFGQCLALCPWHLARYLDAFDDEASRLRDHFDVDDRTPDTLWLGLDDLPTETSVIGEDDSWPLFAFDQRGHAYYADCLEDLSTVAVYAPGEWELYDEWYNVPTAARVRDVADNIADVHGLAALPLDVVDNCADVNGGASQ